LDPAMPKVVAGYKEEARRTILLTAGEVFAEKGYRESTMDDVAKKLGVSKGAVYQYFPSKDELFQELCGSAAQKLEEMLRLYFTGDVLREAAERFMNAELDRAARKTLMFEAFVEAPKNPALDKVLRDNYVACRRVIVDFLEGQKEAGHLKKSVDSDYAAKFLIALRHGVVSSVFQGLSRQEAMEVWLNGFELALAGTSTLGAPRKASH
jgi:AcrR family transcriptional regulator